MNGAPDNDGMRIGTQEREQAFTTLQSHFEAGRIDVHEYDERVAKAVAGKTRAEMRELFADLPPPYPPFLAPPSYAPPSYGPPSYAPPGYTAHPVPPRPPVVHPATPPPAHWHGYSDKSQLAAGLLQVLVPFGVGRFYTGHTGIAVAQLLTSLVFIGVAWSFIDGILLLANGGTDAQGRKLRS